VVVALVAPTERHRHTAQAGPCATSMKEQVENPEQPADRAEKSLTERTHQSSPRWRFVNEGHHEHARESKREKRQHQHHTVRCVIRRGHER